jgi:hypothetical protein
MQNKSVVSLKMEVTEVYQSTTSFGEISTESVGESSTSTISRNFEFLRFSTIDYVVFAVMLAMSGDESGKSKTNRQ